LTCDPRIEAFLNRKIFCMTTGIELKENKTLLPLITAPELLYNWQGHRRLTRRVIETFPDDKLFTYSVAGMRPFSEMVIEFIGMADAGIEGIVTGKWTVVNELLHHSKNAVPKTKEELLVLWDELTEKINKLWSEIPPQRFRETDLAFGQWEGRIIFFIQYWIDNENHHRGQAYVYLRSLGIEPPYFWLRD
jgi:uncharacterized damage-inducible protein DinB